MCLIKDRLAFKSGIHPVRCAEALPALYAQAAAGNLLSAR